MTKVLGWALLLVAGVLCLPVAAALLDDQGSENWILPVDLAVVALFGGVLGAALPGFTNRGRPAVVQRSGRPVA